MAQYLLEYGCPSSEDIEQLKLLLVQCFNTPRLRNEIYVNRIGANNFRVIRQAERVIGGLALMPMSQWWGGQRVPLVGIASVGVASEHRGEGVATMLLQHMLRELYTNSVSLSILYPATHSLYCKLGYETAGMCWHWEMPLGAIQLTQRSLPFHPITPEQYEVLLPLHQQQARQINGFLDRHPLIWQRLFQATEREPVYAYLIGLAEQPTGYLIVSQPRSDSDAGSCLRIKDWSILSADAGHSFWAFLSRYRSQMQQVRWRSAAIDPLASWLPEPTAKVRRTIPWMMRIINVGPALEKRGYPKNIQAELHLEIQDTLLPANNDRFILSVANGRGRVSHGGRGDLTLSIQGLVPLYTGLFTPYQLQHMGRLQSTEQALSIATQLFSGISPWMPDIF